jgi:predicted membrane channel-forming protein YqfA (hemolysin III family)
MSKLMDEINNREQDAYDDNLYYENTGYPKNVMFIIKFFILSFAYLIIKGKGLLPEHFMQNFDCITIFKVIVVSVLWCYLSLFKKMKRSGWVAFGAYVLLSLIGL